MKDSIICNTEMCVVCGKRYGLERHHVFFGRNRQNADEDGLWVWLCADHHRGADGVHGKNGHELDSALKEHAQRVYEMTHTRKEWMDRYRKNYL